MTDNQVPDPDDPEFFAKYTMPQSIRDLAFGPSGGTPAPRVVRPVRRLSPLETTTPQPARPAVTPEGTAITTAAGITVKLMHVGRGQTVHAAGPSGHTYCGAEARGLGSETSTAYGAKAVTCQRCLKCI